MIQVQTGEQSESQGWYCTESYSVTNLEPIHGSQNPLALIGPHEIGAQAIFLPFSWIEAPRVSNPDLAVKQVNQTLAVSYSGLRHVLWQYSKEDIPDAIEVGGDRSEKLLYLTPIVKRQPESVAFLALKGAVEIVKDHCPAHLNFLESYVFNLMRNLDNQIGPDASGHFLPGAAIAARHLQTLCLDATEAFGESSFKQLINLYNDYRLEGHNTFGSEQDFTPWTVPSENYIKSIELQSWINPHPVETNED